MLSTVVRPVVRRARIRTLQHSQGLSRFPSGVESPNPFTSRIQARVLRSTTKKGDTATALAPVAKPFALPQRPFLSSAESVQINAPASLGRQDDGLSRYPNLLSPGGLLRGLDYAGTVTFALTGCITAAQSGLDVFGCCMVGMITGVGGGTIRDAILLSKRPFWTFETEYIWMTIITAFITFFAWPPVIQWQEENRQRKLANGKELKDVQYDDVDAVLDTFDSIGLAAFAIIGAQNGVRAGTSMIVSAICGMGTSTFGGILRDLLCGRPVRIVHSNAEVYAQPALAGAITYLVANRAGARPVTKIGAAMLCCMGSRYLAIRNDVKLHTWDTQNDGLGVAVRRNSN